MTADSSFTSPFTSPASEPSANVLASQHSPGAIPGAMPEGDSLNSSIFAAHILIATLLRAGVCRFIYCPGSRNAPLAYVLAAFETAGLVQVEVWTEERSAGFAALGQIKATRHPVAVVVTSGTAVAELLPAFEEARHQFLPLIAVSADRPFELHWARASQTTDQLELLSADPLRRLEIPAGETRFARRLTQLTGLAQGVGGSSGPVHVNIAFRDPLTPGEDWELEQAAASVAAEFAGELAAGSVTNSPPGAPMVFAPPSPAGIPWSAIVADCEETVLLAGDQADPQVVAAAVVAGVPILAEPTAGVTVSTAPTWIPHAPWIVPHFHARVRQVVVTGHLTLSRPLLALANSREVERVIVVADQYPWSTPLSPRVQVVTAPLIPDEVSSVTAQIASDLRSATVGAVSSAVFSSTVLPAGVSNSFASGTVSTSDKIASGIVSKVVPGKPESAWLRQWRQASAQAEAVIAEASCTLNHLSVAREVWNRPETLWLGASNTIRAFEIAPNLPRPPASAGTRTLSVSASSKTLPTATAGHSYSGSVGAAQTGVPLLLSNPIFSNRGLAGIDGTIAAAVGTASAIPTMASCGTGVRVVMGDNTFVYDLPSLVARTTTRLGIRKENQVETLENSRVNIQIIVLCDQGGTIFSTLEHGKPRFQALHEKYFLAPTRPRVCEIAASCGWQSVRVDSLEKLCAELDKPVIGRSVVEVVVESPAELFTRLREQIALNLENP